jgi:hypothetical protein
MRSQQREGNQESDETYHQLGFFYFVESFLFCGRSLHIVERLLT